MNNGGIIEAVDAALAKIAENIADINTPPTSPAGRLPRRRRRGRGSREPLFS